MNIHNALMQDIECHPAQHRRADVCLFFPNCSLIEFARAAAFVIQSPFSALLWLNPAELTGSFYEQAIVFNSGELLVLFTSLCRRRYRRAVPVQAHDQKNDLETLLYAVVKFTSS